MVDETMKAVSLARCTLMPSAPATASRPWIARQARPVREQPGMAKRDLAGVTGEQHQRHRADRGEQHLAREVEHKAAYQERQRAQRDGKENRCHALRARLEERVVLRIARPEVAARARH